MAKPTKKQRQQAARIERQRLEQARARRARTRRWIPIGLVAVALVAVGLGVLFASRQEPSSGPSDLLTTDAPWPANQTGLPERLAAAGLPSVTAMEQLAYHVHSHLDVFVDGEPVPVPPEIGIDRSVGIAVLHTHEADGIIHIEAAAPEDYTLGQFFDVWGVRLDDACIGGYCDDGASTLEAFVNGEPFDGDPSTLVMQPHDELVIAFGTESELPDPIPATYRFPSGL